MKRKYEKPLLLISDYAFHASFAASCDIQVGENASPEMITIEKGTYLCPVEDNGHEAGKKGAAITKYPVCLFNDGTENSKGCIYDWDGHIVSDGSNSYGSFGNALYGAEANNDNHRPAYQGKVFFS